MTLPHNGMIIKTFLIKNMKKHCLKYILCNKFEMFYGIMRQNDGQLCFFVMIDLSCYMQFVNLNACGHYAAPISHKECEPKCCISATSQE